MDWERTKTVFIMAFLLLNSVFVFYLWIMPTYFDPSMYVSTQQVEAKLAELQYSNITVTAEVPRRLKRLEMLAVKTPVLDHKSLANTILGPHAVLFPSPPSASRNYKYESSAGEVVVYGNNQVTFTRAPMSGESQEISMKSARAKADKFLRTTLGKPKDARHGRIVEIEKGTWVIEYYQRWNRKDLEISRIIIIVDGRGVLQMDYYWVEILGFTGEENVTIPATGALTVATDGMPSGTTISDIYLSWYSSPVLTEQWRCYPVWVIQTTKGVKYYVNAFTGDIEGREEFPAGKPGPTLN